MSLPIHRAAVHEIGLTLAQLDPTGDTVTHGVTSIIRDREGQPDLGRSGDSNGLSRSAHRG